MMKKNKWRLIISSIIILLPIVAGLIMWDILPEQMTTHWGPNGQADGWNGKTFVVFVLPVIMLAFHWLCIFITSLDKKNKNQSDKVFHMIFWVVPIVSVFSCASIYALAFGMEFNIVFIEFMLLGLIFVIIGNYLPKCKQNATIGIRVKWALENEENWHATHRFGGKICVFGGLLIMLCAFLPETVALIGFIVLMTGIVIASIVYSYVYHCKQLKSGTSTTLHK